MKKNKQVQESRSFLSEILLELRNCVRHEQEEVPLVWSKNVQDRLTDTDHWDRANQTRRDSHVGDMDFQDEVDATIIVPYNDNYGHEMPTPPSSDFSPGFGAEDEMAGAVVGDNEDVGLGGYASAPWGDYGDEAFDAGVVDTDEEQEEKHAVDYCPHCACEHVIGEHPEEGESYKDYWKRMNSRSEEQQEYHPPGYRWPRLDDNREDPEGLEMPGAREEFNRREEPDIEMAQGGAAYNDVMGYNDDEDFDQDEDRVVDIGDEEDYPEDTPDVWDRFGDRRDFKDKWFDDEESEQGGDEEEETMRFADFYRLDDEENGNSHPVVNRAKKKFEDEVDLRGRQKTRRPIRDRDYEEQQEESPMDMGSQGGPQGAPSQPQMSPSRASNPDETSAANMAVDNQYGEDDPNNKGEDFGDATGTGEAQEWDDPDYQGVIRTVKKAHLIFKRQQEDGTFDELWMYNLGHDFKRELKVRRAILAGTDIPPNKMRSPDRKQTYELWTAGNGQVLHIKGLPN